MTKARISLGSSTEYTLKYLNVTILKKTDCKDFLRLKRYSSGVYLPLREVCKCVPELRVNQFYALCFSIVFIEECTGRTENYRVVNILPDKKYLPKSET